MSIDFFISFIFPTEKSNEKLFEHFLNVCFFSCGRIRSTEVGEANDIELELVNESDVIVYDVFVLQCAHQMCNSFEIQIK